MPKLATVASQVGHGVMGLRDNLRTLDELTARSVGQKHVFAELRGAKILTGWTVHAGSVYKVTTNEVVNGRRADCVSVKTASETLTRAQSVTEVAAGYFFCESDTNAATTLYVRLSDSSDPSATDVYGVFSFHFGTCNVVQALLGRNLLVDGGLEDWATPTNLTSWTEETIWNGGGTIATQETDVVFLGSSSAAFGGTLNAAGGRGIMQTTTAGGGASSAITNKPYRFAFAYRTVAGLPAGLTAALQVKIGSSYALSNGRDWTASDTRLSLAPTNGAWRRAAFDYVAPADGHHIARVMAYNTSAARSGAIYFDDLRLSRIDRFELHGPWLSLDSVPRNEEGRQGIFFDQWTVGSGQLTILNGDGDLEALFGTYEWINGEVYIRVGGKFLGGWNEILPEDMLQKRWLIRRIDVTDTQAVLALEDPRTIFRETLPNRFYNTDVFPDIADRDVGRGRPLVYAADIQNVRPAAIDFSGPTGYRIYELYDPLFNVYPGPTLGLVLELSYQSEEDAEKGTGPVLQPDPFNQTAADAQIYSTVDFQQIRIEEGVNDKIDFNEDGVTPLVATITGGVYFPQSGGATSLAQAVQDALNAVSSVPLSYQVLYDNTSTKQFTITWLGGATLEFQLDSAAPNRDRSIMPTLGFTGDTNLTGSLSYTADAALLSVSPERGREVDARHIFRVEIDGYQDDGNGTYTGTAGQRPISLSPDIMYHLLRAVMGVPVELIDTGSLVHARPNCNNNFVYIGGIQSGGAADDSSHELGQIIEWLENSSGVELLVRDGIYTWRKRDNTTPANIIDLYDRDFTYFQSWLDQDDMASTIRMESYANPSTGQVGTVEVSSNIAKLRLGRTVTKVVSSYFGSLADASDMLAEFLVNASTPRRRFKFGLKGKGLKLIPGDKLRIFRSSFVGRTDAAPSVVVRILRKIDDLQSWSIDIDAAEVLDVSSGW